MMVSVHDDDAKGIVAAFVADDQHGDSLDGFAGLRMDSIDQYGSRFHGVLLRW
jgi:hypothetical protein